ncbi:MAG: pyruvoyl-dependent arginine decarboxylase [Candidatus Bathyarchaeia archaeon]
MGGPDYPKLIPQKFCVVSGSATSKLSPLNAFDLALQRAGIANCNIVRVSSIIPPTATLTKLPKSLTPGTILFTTMAKMMGKGEIIGTGIAWSWGTTESGERYGIIAEAQGRDVGSLEEELIDRLKAMASARGLKLGALNVSKEIIEIPEDHYGCSFSALIFLP